MSLHDDPASVHQNVPPNAEENTPLAPVSRRNFLKIAGAFIAASSIGVTAACASEPAPPAQPADLGSTADNVYPEVPVDPMIAPDSSVLKVFSVHEAQTVEAFTARILPGTPADPGAREAGVVTYIDNMLSFNEGFDEPTYRQAPYAETYDSSASTTSTPTTAAPGTASSSQYQVVYVQKSELSRYGFQSINTPRESYRLGIVALDQYSQSKFSKNFADLTEDQQDQIVGDFAGGKAASVDSSGGKNFFTMLRTDTINGMFSDPGYGGNRNMVGWRLIGYPGAQRAYTPYDIKTEGGPNPRPPQSLMQMRVSHPGQAANQNVILPQSGQGSSDSATPQMPNIPLVPNLNQQH